MQTNQWFSIFSMRLVIKQPINKVFEFVSHLENFSLFYPSIKKMVQAEGKSPAVGVGYNEELKGFGQLSSRHMITSITDLEKNKKVGLKTNDGIIDFQVYYYFLPLDNNTTEVLYHGGSYKKFNPVFLWFAIPLFKLRLSKEIQGAMRNLKKILEQNF